MININYAITLLFLLTVNWASAQFSAFHKAHTGQLVFCNEPVQPGNEHKQKLMDTWHAGQTLYAMAYFSSPFQEVAQTKEIGFEVWINGEKQSMQFIHPGTRKMGAFYPIINQYTNRPFYPVEIRPAKHMATNEAEVEAWARLVSDLPKGEHQLRIRMVHAGGILAEGQLNLHWQDFDRAAFKQQTDNLLEAIRVQHAKGLSLPEAFDAPSQRFIDPDMTEEEIKFKLLLSDAFNNVEDFQMVVIGSGRDWVTLRNKETNIPELKVNKRPIRVVYKGKDGWCYYVEKVYFTRPFKGGGKFGPPMYARSSEHHRINCRSVK